MNEYFVHKSSFVDDDVKIGKNTKIWHFCHIQKGAELGENCSLGQNVNIANNVKIGNYVKIQNNVSVYEGVELEDYVFCGPSMVFTNDLTPRAKYPAKQIGWVCECGQVLDKNQKCPSCGRQYKLINDRLKEV